MPVVDLTSADAGPDRRSVVVVRGPDAATFLHGVLTADVAGWDRSAALPAALLTRKGQIVAEVVLVPGPGGEIRLVVPADVAQEAADLLDRYLVMDDAEVAPAPESSVAFAWGDDVADVEAGEGGVIVPTRHPAEGVLAVGLAGAPAGAPGDMDAFHLHRVRCGRPGWRRELCPGRLPPEVGYADAVSYDKGCYLGQEPLARVHARGGVRRVMVQVEGPAAGPVALPAGLSAEGREDAGTLTTLCGTPEGVLGLALVHRSVAQPGTVVRPARGPELTVTSGPIGDDPGVGDDRKARMRAARAQLRRGR